MPKHNRIMRGIDGGALKSERSVHFSPSLRPRPLEDAPPLNFLFLENSHLCVVLKNNARQWALAAQDVLSLVFGRMGIPAASLTVLGLCFEDYFFKNPGWIQGAVYAARRL